MDPLLVAPFDLGWTREVIRRSKSTLIDIYYRSPAGKKYRSLKEISREADLGGLAVNNFSFERKPLGIDDPLKEVISQAKGKEQRASKRSSEAENSGPTKKRRISSQPAKSVYKSIKAHSKPKEKVPKKTLKKGSNQSVSLEGWTREVVHRSTGSSVDIYYLSPAGKKFRSIKDFERANLPLDNISFEKKALGENSGLVEVVRHAQTPRKSVEQKKKKSSPARKGSKSAEKSSQKANGEDGLLQDSPTPSTSSS